jgi:hypothetical protein
VYNHNKGEQNTMAGLAAFGRIWPYKGQFTHSKQGKPFCKMPTGISKTSGVRWRDPVTIFYQEKSKVTGLVIF